ncbi:MAG: hypothetical protein NVS3B10_28260 [Polyangiales bacterium]
MRTEVGILARMPETAQPLALLRVYAAGATDLGQSRQHNEDAILVRNDLGLYLLADGAGGQNAGNVASALATTTVAHYFEETHEASKAQPTHDELGLSTAARRLARAIQAANREIIAIAKTHNNYHGMGTTIVAAFAQPELAQLHVGHVGDSRCYRLRDARLEALTDDHSLANDVLELRPDLDDAVLGRLPKHVITRALGMGEPMRVAMRTHAVIPGDRFLLCSDGLTNTLSDEEIGDVLRSSRSPEEAVQLLLDLANAAGADDNLAVVIANFDLSPGVSAFPRRGSAAPRKRPSSRAVTDASSPEIVIVGMETLDDELGAQIHVVPSETSSPNLLSAMGSFVSPLRPPRVPTRTGAPTCSKCGRAIENRGLVCGHCGTPREVKA